jgi:hypothetical protein
MKIRIEHDFEGVDAVAYESLYFDEAFNLVLAAALKLGRELRKLERTQDRIVRHVCFDAKHDPASPVGQAFGTSRASFVEELDYDRRARRGAWRTVPNLFAKRVRNAGTIELVDTPRGVRRIVEGDVEVSLLGFGRRVERMIVQEIETSYETTTRVTREWLASHPR